MQGVTRFNQAKNRGRNYRSVFSRIVLIDSHVRVNTDSTEYLLKVNAMDAVWASLRFLHCVNTFGFQALEVSLLYLPSLTYWQAGRSLYSPQNPFDLGGGKNAHFGFYMSLRPGEKPQEGWTMTLTVNSTCFPRIFLSSLGSLSPTSASCHDREVWLRDSKREPLRVPFCLL